MRTLGEIQERESQTEEDCGERSLQEGEEIGREYKARKKKEMVSTSDSEGSDKGESEEGDDQERHKPRKDGRTLKRETEKRKIYPPLPRYSSVILPSAPPTDTKEKVIESLRRQLTISPNQVTASQEQVQQLTNLLRKGLRVSVDLNKGEEEEEWGKRQLFPVIEQADAQGQPPLSPAATLQRSKNVKRSSSSVWAPGTITAAILEGIAGYNLCPNDWKSLCRAVLSGGDYLFVENC